jgi:hypothetical protein
MTTTTEDTEDMAEADQPKPDIAKLRAVYDTIAAAEADRLAREAAGEKVLRQWDQRLWGIQVDVPTSSFESCGAAFCFAGWTAKLDGCDMDWRSDATGNVKVLESVRPAHTIRWRAVWEYAAESLGITEAQADQLFNASNSLATIKAMIDALDEDPEVYWETLSDLASEHNDPEDAEDEDRG